MLAYRSFADSHRVKLYSMKTVERLDAEINWGTGFVGNFPNDHAIIRLVAPCYSKNLNGRAEGSLYDAWYISQLGTSVRCVRSSVYRQWHADVSGTFRGSDGSVSPGRVSKRTRT